jgi:hypothetical protein
VGERATDGPSRTSDLLEEIEEKEGGDRISLGEIADITGGRAFGLLLLILALPETIPMIGLSAILAAPIFVLGGALLIRGDDPSIPGWVRDRSVPREKVRGAIRRTRRVVAWLDRVSRPRWPRMANAARLQGAVCILMAVVLAIPIPGINIVAALAVALTGVGILQRDGLVTAAAAVAALAAAFGFALVGLGAWTTVGGWL